MDTNENTPQPRVPHLHLDSFEAVKLACYQTAEDKGFHHVRAYLKESDRRIIASGLIASEASEALEAARKNDTDNYLEELADVLIRVLDEAEYVERQFSSDCQDFADIVHEKMKKNASRPYLHGKVA